MDQLGDISNLATKMDIDPADSLATTNATSPPPSQNMIYNDDAEETHVGDEMQSADPLRGLFYELPTPILQAPPQPTPMTRDTRPHSTTRKTMAATRSSLHQAARPSPISVVERAT